MTKNSICIVAAAALLALCGCSRTAIEDGGNAGREIGYTIAVSPVVKGALINTSGEDKPLSGFLDVTDNFTVDAFNDAGAQTITATTVTWNADHSRFESDPVSYWPQATRLTFLASANMPTGEQAADIATVSATKDGITLTYKAVPTGAADQRDILLGTYVGAGSNTGLAEIRFEHPLTAVIFKVGTVSQKITEVRLKGLATAGKVTLDASHMLGGWTAISGSDISSYDLTASVSNSESLTKGATVGTPFVVIPQNLAEQHVEVTVTLADGTSGTITLSEGKWLAGKTNTYTINFGSATGYALSITEWDSETYPVELEEEQSDLLTFIDLGLPSGTLWADRNIGAESVKDEPTCCGDYYAWSMTETYYDQASSNPPVDIVWKDAYSNGYAQYAWPAEKYNATDGLKKLELTDDVANVVLGNDARIPSVAQWNELIANCKITKTNNGGHGYVTLTSKLNDASIILPAAGFYSVKENTNYGNFGVYYMTSELYSDISQIYALWCGASENLQCKGGYSRFAGLPVRAVKPGPVKIGGVYWATKNVGAKTVAGSPSTSYGDYFAWGETAPYYSSISFNNASSATIGWKEDYKTKGYDWENYKYCSGTNKTLTKYNTDAVCGNVDNKTVLESSDDAATANWGSSWRMPTYEDFQNLYKACTDKAENAAPESLPETITKGGVYWSDSYDGVAGILFVDKLDISKRVFFPAAGYFCEGTSFTAGGSIAAYWSSSLLDDSRNAHNMRFSTATVNPSYPTGARQYGFPVRPVKDAD